MTSYIDIERAVADHGMAARGGFGEESGRFVVMIGNIGGAIWPNFEAARSDGADPLDTWTRAVLGPIAYRFAARFIHPSDQPFQPFQQWAARADTVFASPIGLLIHPTAGLWHAYRGAFLFDDEISDVPSPDTHVTSPCLDCADQPCLAACPVDAFTHDAYDVAACVGHLQSGIEPDCRSIGCRARAACPVGVDFTYGAEQMRFHMDAFAAARGVAASG